MLLLNLNKQRLYLMMPLLLPVYYGFAHSPHPQTTNKNNSDNLVFFAVGVEDRARVTNKGDFEGYNLETQINLTKKKNKTSSLYFNFHYLRQDLDCACEDDKRELFGLTIGARKQFNSRLAKIFSGGGFTIYGHDNLEEITYLPYAVTFDGGIMATPFRNVGVRLRYFFTYGLFSESVKYYGSMIDFILRIK